MTITEPVHSENPSDNLICPGCATLLPSHTTFCTSCGERINKKKNKEGRARTENGDDDVQEQQLADTVPMPSVSQARWKGFSSYRLLKINVITRRIRKSRLLPFDVETQTSEELTTPSLHVADIDTQQHGAVPLSQHLGQQVTRQPSVVDASGTQIGITLIRHPWLLTRSLVYRVRNNSLLRNSVYIMGTNVTTAVFGYLYWILAAHLYSAYDIGLASALISAMTLASTFANLGIGSTLVQTLPRREAGYAWSLTLNAGLATGIVAGLLAGGIMIIALPLFSNQFAIAGQLAEYVLVVVIGVPLTTLSTLLDQAFIAERSAHNMLIRNAAVAILKIPLMILPVVLISRVGALGILSSGVVAMAVVVVGGMLLLVPRLGRAYCLAARGIVGQVRSMFSSLVGNHFINIGGLAYQYLLPVFVAIRLSPVENAYYYTTSRVGDFFLIGSAAVASALFAEGSHVADDLPHKVRSSAVIIGMLMGPGMLVCFFGGQYILSVFGPSYAQHGLMLLRIAVISTVPDAITNIYVSVLRVQRRLRFAALLNLGMAAIALILGWILLPMLGIVGAGLAFLIAQVAGSLAAGVDVIRFHRHRRAII